MNELPKKVRVYKDRKVISEIRQIKYGICFNEVGEEFRMFYGPHLDINDVLCIDPSGLVKNEKLDKIFIIRFNADSTNQRLYKWDNNDESWNLIESIHA